MYREPSKANRRLDTEGPRNQPTGGSRITRFDRKGRRRLTRGGKRLAPPNAPRGAAKEFLNSSLVSGSLIRLLDAEEARLARRRRRLYWKRLVAAAGALLLVAGVFTFAMGFSIVEGPSMLPTLHQGDMAVYFRRTSAYTPGDIVVFRRENSPDLVKRVIAVVGDVVDVDKNGRLTVNGMALSEPYAIGTGRHTDSIAYPLTVPPGELFVLGDNRDVSVDSRNAELGLVSETQVRGVVITVLRIGS